MSIDPGNEVPSPAEFRRMCVKFVQKHGKFLGYHAAYLHALEGEAESNRNQEETQEDAAAEGLYSRQAEYLHTLSSWIGDQARGKPLINTTPQQRLEMQTMFSHAIGAINMILQQYVVHKKNVMEGVNPKILASRYREEHFLTRDDPIPDDVRREIREIVDSNRRENRHMATEIANISDMKADIQAIRDCSIQMRPGRGSGGAGSGSWVSM